MARQTRTALWFSRHPGTNPNRDCLYSAGVGVDVVKSEFSFCPRSRSCAHSARGSLAAGHLYLRSANAQFLDRAGPVVSLVHRRRSRTRMGPFPAYTLFLCRNDRHNGCGVFLRQQFFERHAHRVVVLRLCTILSRRGHLHPFYSAGKNQMARLGFRRVLAARICAEFEFVPRRAHSSVRELLHIFRSRNCSSDHASP